jgi:HemY protein
MIRLILFFAIVVLVAAGAVWLADQPGSLTLNWQAYEIRVSALAAATAALTGFALLYMIIRLIRNILAAPKTAVKALRSRRRKKGYQALTRGLIAASHGHGKLAEQLSNTARKLLPEEPLTLLLQAQTAQIKGEEAGAAKVFRTMLESPDTQVLGLRGLFTQARKDGETDVARAIAARAVKLEPDSPWASAALLELQSSTGSWLSAERTLELQKRHKLISKARARRLRAVLLTAQAMEKENTEPEAALSLALEAHKLAPELVPAAVLAGRLLAQKGKHSRAAKVLEKTWSIAPHPDLAEVYAHLRMGDKPPERLKRIQTLAARTPGHPEAAMALARAAIEARDWAAARQALEPLLEEPGQNTCLLMAQIEDGEFGDRGRAREWLSRALRARRDPVWIADGFESERWAPVSPVTGQLDAFEWKVPHESLPPATAVLDEAVIDMAEHADGDDKGAERDGDNAVMEILPPEAPEPKITEAEKPVDAGGDGPDSPEKPVPQAGTAAEEKPETTAILKPAAHQPDDPGPLKEARTGQKSSIFGFLHRPDA